MNILIIGGSRGIGKETARQLIAAGNRVLITGRSKEHLSEAKAELQSVLTYGLDVTDAVQVDALFEYTSKNFPVDGLILNAASFPNPDTKQSVLEPQPEELAQILDANVVAHYRIARTFLPMLEKSEVGRIVIVGSTSGIRRDKGGVYGISKWALRSYAYGLREECIRHGVGVSLVNPGGTFTETRKKADENDRSLLETSDIGILIATIFRLSPQAVIEQLDVRPLAGDTY